MNPITDTPPPTTAAAPKERTDYIAPILPEKRPRSISLYSLMHMNLRPREHLIMPWLRQGESAMVFAPPGVGKSLFALSLALAVAGGGKLLNYWDAPTPRRVLYVDGEMPLDDIKDRAAMLLPASGGDAETAMRNLYIEARQYQDSGVTFTDLASDDSRETLISKAKHNKVDLIILDNLSTLATIEDENAASAFNAPITFLLRLKQEGLACLLVHHSSKNGESYRGSSKIATTFEAIAKLEPNRKPADGYNKTGFRLSWEKLRGKRDRTTSTALDVSLDTCLFDGEDGQQKAGGVRWVCEPSEDQRIETMLALLRSGEYGTQKQLAAAMPDGGVPNYALTRLKQRALAQGAITEKEWIACLARAQQAYNASDEEEEAVSAQDVESDY